MLQKIRLQARGGVHKIPYVPDSAAYEAARTAGELTVGMDIVYKTYIVQILEDYSMFIVDSIQKYMPVMNMGDVPVGGNWSFTVNGVPVDPAQFMNGGGNQ